MGVLMLLERPFSIYVLKTADRTNINRRQVKNSNEIPNEFFFANGRQLILKTEPEM